MCCSVNHIDDLQSSNKTSHGPSVFRAHSPLIEIIAFCIGCILLVQAAPQKKCENLYSDYALYAMFLKTLILHNKDSFKQLFNSFL